MEQSADADAKRRAQDEHQTAAPAETLVQPTGSSKKRKALGPRTSEASPPVANSVAAASKESPASGHTHIHAEAQEASAPARPHEAPENAATAGSDAVAGPASRAQPQSAPSAAERQLPGAGAGPSSANASPSLEDLLQLIKGHPDTEAAVAAALSAVQRLKRAAPSTSTGSQPGGATKRAATHVASHADDACDLAQKLARSKVQGSPEDSHSAHSGSSGPGDASGTQHPQGDDPSVATSRLPGVGQDESSTHVPLNQGTHSDTKDTSAPQSPDIHVPLLGQLSLQAGIGPAPVAPQGPAHRTTGSDHHAGDSGVVEAGTDVSGSQGRESKPKKARSQVAAAAPQAQVATSTGMGSGKGGQAQASQQVQTESAQAQGAPSASPPRTQSHSQVSLSTSVPSWPAPDTPTDAAVSAAAPPDMASYLDGFPLAKEMIYTVRGTPNNSTKTPLALVNEYAARLTLEVSWKEDSDSPAGPYTATCTLKSRLGTPPDASGTGRGRNKRDARQVAAAACMELLLGPKFNLKLGDFVPQSRPPAPTHSAKRDSFRQNAGGYSTGTKWGSMKKMREDQGPSAPRPVPGYTRAVTGHQQQQGVHFHQRRDTDMQLHSPRGMDTSFMRGPQPPPPNPLHPAPHLGYPSSHPHTLLDSLDPSLRPLGYPTQTPHTLQGYGTQGLMRGPTGPNPPVRDSGTPNALSMHSLQAILPAASEMGLGSLQQYAFDSLGVSGLNTGALDLSGLHGSLEAARASSAQAQGSNALWPPAQQATQALAPQGAQAALQHTSAAALLAGLPLSAYGMDQQRQSVAPPRSPQDPSHPSPHSPSLYDTTRRPSPPVGPAPVGAFPTQSTRDPLQPPLSFLGGAGVSEGRDSQPPVPVSHTSDTSGSWSPWSLWGPNAASSGSQAWPGT